MERGQYQFLVKQITDILEQNGVTGANVSKISNEIVEMVDKTAIGTKPCSPKHEYIDWENGKFGPGIYILDYGEGNRYRIIVGKGIKTSSIADESEHRYEAAVKGSQVFDINGEVYDGDYSDIVDTVDDLFAYAGVARWPDNRFMPEFSPSYIYLVGTPDTVMRRLVSKIHGMVSTKDMPSKPNVYKI